MSDVNRKYIACPEDFSFLGDMGGFDLEVHDVPPTALGENPDAMPLVAAMAQIFIREGVDAFLQFVGAEWQTIREYAQFEPKVAQTLVAAYRVGVGQENGDCANNLGALYYMGELVGQDYAAAADLYEMAVGWGCLQSVVNLGYIYENGRLGEPDFAKAYEWFSLAACLSDSSEAVYKLGDMYSRGRGVDTDDAKAMMLWERSLSLAVGDEEVAQPAFRIAKAVLNDDPLRALSLFQRAEVGLRISVSRGMGYYRKRLQEAMHGQDAARMLLDDLILD